MHAFWIHGIGKLRGTDLTKGSKIGSTRHSHALMHMAGNVAGAEPHGEVLEALAQGYYEDSADVSWVRASWNMWSS